MRDLLSNLWMTSDTWWETARIQFHTGENLPSYYHQWLNNLTITLSKLATAAKYNSYGKIKESDHGTWLFQN